MTKNNWVTISAAITREQRTDLNQKATDCGMNISEYIKARLLIDEDDTSSLHAKNLSKFEKDLMSATTKLYSLIHTMAGKKLDEGEISKAHEVAERMLETKGYK